MRGAVCSSVQQFRDPASAGRCWCAIYCSVRPPIRARETAWSTSRAGSVWGSAFGRPGVAKERRETVLEQELGDGGAPCPFGRALGQPGGRWSATISVADELGAAARRWMLAAVLAALICVYKLLFKHTENKAEAAEGVGEQKATPVSQAKCKVEAPAAAAR